MCVGDGVAARAAPVADVCPAGPHALHAGGLPSSPAPGTAGGGHVSQGPHLHHARTQGTHTHTHTHICA